MNDMKEKLEAVLVALDELREAFATVDVKPTVWFVGSNEMAEMSHFIGMRVASMGDGKVDFNKSILIESPITASDVLTLKEFFSEIKVERTK